MLITPALARELLLTANARVRQRPLSPERVQRFVAHIQRGTFKKDSTASFCLDRGRLQLHNGQHRLAAIAACGRPVELNIQLHPLDATCWTP